MKNINLIVSFVFVTLLNVVSFGQESTYFVLGEQALSNTSIYSICQTKNDLVYIATDRGLFVYRNGSFTQIPGAQEQQGRSLFNIKLDNNGVLYCGNLRGQIFKLVDDRLDLVFALAKEKIGIELRYEFDNRNNLLVASGNECYMVNEKVGASKIYATATGIFSLKKLHSGRVLMRTASLDSLVFVTDGVAKVEHYPIENTNDYNPYLHSIQELNGKLFSVFSNGNIQMISNDLFDNRVEPVLNERYFQFSKDIIWALDHANGIRKIQFNDQNELIAEDKMYKDKFISSIFVSKNGTVFLGTFGEGLLVVPNQSTKRHVINQDQFKANGIAVDEDNNVFLSTRKGRVIHYGTTAEVIEDIPGKSIERIFFAKGIDFGINPVFPSIVYNGKFELGSVKDIYQVDESNVFIATSIGIFKTGDEPENSSWIKTENQNLIRFPGFLERCQSVAFCSKTKKIHVASSLGLFQVVNGDDKKEIFHEGKSIICQDILIHNQELWCATNEYGILIFRDGELVRKIDKSNGLRELSVRKIELKDNQLFVNHKNGIQVLNLKSNDWITLGTAEGIINGSVSDFALSIDKLWILSDGQPISLMLNNLPQKNPTLKISIDSVLVSGVLTEFSSKQCFSYEENKFSFYVNFNGLKYESEAELYYRIIGFDNGWKVAPATKGLIQYDYLPPGNYTFEIKVKYRADETAVKRYDFTISPPYWQTAWFVLIVVVVFMLLLIGVYLYQIKRIKLRNKEKLEKQKIQTDLLESELRALRSQMNPHFIFNSLNSIQDLILQQDTDASYDYIVLFADLVRSTLNYSNKDFIAIEKELEFLEVYLSLEKLRFEEDFNYKISFKGSKEVNVPSLIVQPFIENALVHGLLHKEGQKNLTIAFEYSDRLVCTVTDNGVGRERAKEIQKRRGNHHESFALDAIEKRLSILSEQHGSEVGYEVSDLYDGENPIGTKVVITMPFKEQF